MLIDMAPALHIVMKNYQNNHNYFNELATNKREQMALKTELALFDRLHPNNEQ